MAPCWQDALKVPRLNGTITFSSDGSITIDVATEPTTYPLIPGNFFTLYDFFVLVQVSKASGSESAVFVIEVGGDVLIGGSNGFLCSISGYIDTIDGGEQGRCSAYLDVEHAGGWSPLPGALGDLFRTPQFSGSVCLDRDGVYLELGATAEFLHPIPVLPGLLELTGYPPDRTAEGPSLELAMTRQTDTSSTQFEVNLTAAIRIGSGSGAPPLIMIDGTLRSCGGSELHLATETAWQPLPNALPGLRIPRIWGSLYMRDSGQLEVSVSHDPLPDIELGSILAFTGWQASLHVDATPAEDRTPDECSSGSADESEEAPSKDAVVPSPAPSTPPSYDVSVTIHVTGGLQLMGGSSRAPPLLRVEGTISFDGNTELRIQTLEEWAPLAGAIVRVHAPMLAEPAPP